MEIPGVLSGHNLRSHLLNKQIETGAFSYARPIGVDLGITLASRASQPRLDQQSFWILLQIANRVKSACNSFTHLSPFVVALRFCWPEGVSYFLIMFFKRFFFPWRFFSLLFFKPFFSPEVWKTSRGIPRGPALRSCSVAEGLILPPYCVRDMCSSALFLWFCYCIRAVGTVWEQSRWAAPSQTRKRHSPVRLTLCFICLFAWFDFCG